MASQPLSTFPPKPRRTGPKLSKRELAETRGRKAGKPLDAKAVRAWMLRERMWVAIRDRPHPGRMSFGICIDCYGWVSDPRHNGFALQIAPRSIG
jgi:hypothetical protein